MKMRGIFCCCRQSEQGSFDLNDPNTVSILPTEVGKPQPVPPDEADGDLSRHDHGLHKDPVPPPGYPFFEKSEDPELLPVPLEDDGSVMGAVNMLDVILDREENLTFYDCVEDGVSDKISVREYCKELSVTDDNLRAVMCNLDQQISLGLNPATKPRASTKCWTTYVQDLPTGREVGNYLALDLGGTKFRVLIIRLNGEQFDMKSKVYDVPQKIMTGTSDQLFDHIADCLASFTKEHNCNRDSLPLGFTFSFPCKQVSLQKGILQRWTKGFNASDVVDHDVVCLLKKAIERRDDLVIDVMAILNDTTGTLMSCAWKNHNTKMGVILGTGTNACYVERTENIPGFDGDQSKPCVIVNIEWGAFGDNGELAFIRTPYDIEVDSKSLNPGQQIFEKMISGMYLGEIVRLILVELAKKKMLFDGCLSEELNSHDSFETSYISEIEEDKRGCYVHCQKILNKLNVKNYTDQDCANVRYICETVTRRAAYLASAGVATVLNRMKCESGTVGVDGSLYRYHPYFHDIMTDKIAELVEPKIKFQLMLSEDGSGRGAALVAAAAKDSSENK